MNAMLHWFTSAEWAQIVKALLHSLWQGAVVALVLAIVMRRLANPVSRYRCSLAALVVVVVAGMLTWAVINSSERQKPAPISIQPIAQNQTAPDYIPPLNLDSPDKIVVVVNRPPVATSLRWTAWLALVWLAGAAAMLTRAGVKVAGAEKLRRSCRPLNDERVEKLLAEARRAIGLAKQVRIGVTDKLTSPAVVGLFVPMLILPLSLMTTLTPEQIQFVLLHELAHIRRGDYLANLFQFFAESLLFFNPAVWWISHQLRREREACCDALAIELSGAPVDYARTLVHVAEKMMQPAPAAAMSLGNKREPSSLIDRVQRLLVPGYRPSLRLTWRAMLTALVLGVLLLVLSATGTRLTVAAILPSNSSVASSSSLSNSVPLSLIGMTNTDWRTRDRSPVIGMEALNEHNVIEAEAQLKRAIVNARDEELQKQTNNPPGINLRESPYINSNATAPAKAVVSWEMFAKAPYINSNATAPAELTHAGEPQLRTMTFKIDTYTGFANLRKESGLPATSSRKEQLQKLFAEAGETPPLTNIFVTDEGVLVVRGAKEQLDSVNKVVEKLNGTQSNYARTLTQGQMDVVNRALEKLNGTTSNNSQTLPVPNPMARTNLIYTSKSRQDIASKLENIRLDSVHYDNEPLSLVISNLYRRVAALDSTKRGVNVILESNVTSLSVTIEPAMTNVRLVDVLDAFVKNSEKPIRYSIEDYAVVFSLRMGREPLQLFTRNFKVDPNTFSSRVSKQTGITKTSLNLADSGGSVSRKEVDDATGGLLTLLSDTGVNLDPPKAAFYNDRNGLLVVRASAEDLDIIESVVQALNYSPPQINIKAEFIEVNVSGNVVYLGSVSVSATNNAAGRNLTSNTPTMFFPFNPTGSSPINANPQTAKFLGVLSPAQANTTRAALKSNPRAVVVSTPEVTTLSDRQAQIRIGDMVTIVNGINPLALTPPGITVTNKNDTALYILDQMSFGTSLDVFPHVSADGYTIHLTVIPKITAFLGYDKPTTNMTVYVNGKKQTVPVPQPQFYSDSLTNSMAVWDGQTLVLGGLISESNIEVTDKVPLLGDLPGFLGRPFRSKSSTTIKKNVFVFITPTLIDPAGNRIHTEEEMPFAKEGIPVQSK